MLDHVTIRVADRQAFERLYGTVLSALGIQQRPQYGDDYYGAFLLDPDGNKSKSSTTTARNPA